MYALFLLALLADVARAHALVRVGADSGVVAHGESRLPLGVKAATELVPAEAKSPAARLAAIERLAQRFSGWSKSLSGLSSPVLLASSGLFADLSAESISSSKIPLQAATRSVFEHTASPAP